MDNQKSIKPLLIQIRSCLFFLIINQFHVMIRSAHGSSAQINTSSRDVPLPTQDKAPRKRDLMKNFIFLSPKFRSNMSYSTLTLENISIFFISKPEEITRHLEPAIRKQKIRSIVQQRGDVHPQAKLQYIVTDDQGPIRQYYHSRTNLPISASEWHNMEDSDDEDDDYWIRQLGESVRVKNTMSLLGSPIEMI